MRKQFFTHCPYLYYLYSSGRFENTSTVKLGNNGIFSQKNFALLRGFHYSDRIHKVKIMLEVSLATKKNFKFDFVCQRIVFGGQHWVLQI